MSAVFWIAVLFSFSSWDAMIVRFTLPVYDVWSAKEDIIGFLSVEVDISDRLYLKERPIPFPMVKMSTTKQIYDKWDYVKNSTKSKYVKILMNDQNIMFGLFPLWKNSKNRKISNNIFWWMLKIMIFDIPLLHREYYLFSQSTERYFEK